MRSYYQNINIKCRTLLRTWKSLKLYPFWKPIYQPAVVLCILVCCCLVTESCLTLCDPMDRSTQGFPVIHYLRKYVQVHVSWVGDATSLILCHLLLLLPSIFPSIRVFSSELAVWIRWPKYLSFSFSISLSYEYSGLTSLRIDWFDLLAVQGTLESSLAPQYESIISSALSFLYGPTLTSTHDYWKTHNFDSMDLCWQSDVLPF